MTNEDLKRFYSENPDTNEPLDFVRLDENGLIPDRLIPSKMTNVIEGYYYNSKFYEDQTHTKEIVGHDSTIYLDLSTNHSYRWTGLGYTLVGDGDTKLYQHNITFMHSEDEHLMYYFNFINSSSTQISTKTDLLETLFALYGISGFTGVVNNTGEGDYANPLGVFTANCGSTGSNLHVNTPCYLDSTVTINDTEYTFSKMIVNTIGDATLTALSDSVVQL